MTTTFYIVTGLSGAGKSQALKILEDLGFFCVDNIPVSLLPKFADMCREIGGRLKNVALGIDIRAGRALSSLEPILAEIKRKKIDYRIIYFTANDDTLLKRFSETRRRHPLGRRVLEGIRKERILMERLLNIADQEIDTSYLTLGDLKEIIAKAMNVAAERKMIVSVMSFGYKHGIPLDADLVMDVRFLPNPNYAQRLRSKTGKDAAVRKYVEQQQLYKGFFSRWAELIDFLLPHYVREGKSYFTIAVGCTGGHHRSVVVAEEIARHLRSGKYPVRVYHRDIVHQL